MKNLREILRDNKASIGASLGAMATTIAACPAFAAEDTASTMQTSLQTGLNSMVNDFIGYVALVVPIGLTVFGATFGVKKAIQFFRSISSK